MNWQHIVKNMGTLLSISGTKQEIPMTINTVVVSGRLGNF